MLEMTQEKTLTNYLILEKVIRKQAVLKKEYGLTRSEIATLLTLALYFNPAKEYIYPSQDKLAEILGDNKSNISKYLSVLKNKDLILSFKKGNRKYYKLSQKLIIEIGLENPYIIFLKNQKKDFYN